MKDEIGAAIFDLDGTLVQTEALYAHAVAKVASEYGVLVRHADYMRQLAGLPLRVVFSRLLPWALVPEATARARTLFWQQAGSLQPAEGVVEFLAAIGRLPRAVATNADRLTAARMLSESGLAAAFPVVVSADDLESRSHKPAPDVFLTAAKRLGVAPGRCVAFEDSPQGVEAARRAGMRVVCVSTAVVADEPKSFLRVSGFLDERLRGFVLDRLPRRPS